MSRRVARAYTLVSYGPRAPVTSPSPPGLPSLSHHDGNEHQRLDDVREDQRRVRQAVSHVVLEEERELQHPLLATRSTRDTHRKMIRRRRKSVPAQKSGQRVEETTTTSGSAPVEAAAAAAEAAAAAAAVALLYSQKYPRTRLEPRASQQVKCR